MPPLRASQEIEGVNHQVIDREQEEAYSCKKRDFGGKLGKDERKHRRPSKSRRSERAAFVITAPQ